MSAAGVALLALLALAQQPFPRADADPEGVVVDERGAPVAGATVAFLAEFPADSGYLQAAAQILRRTPLPSGRSDQDGHFVLPLSQEQRTLGTWPGSGHEVIWLVVSKAGHLTWREPLTMGLRGHLGSRVVLPTLASAGEFAALPWPPLLQQSAVVHCDVIQPLPGAAMRPLVRRPGASAVAAGRGDQQLVIRVRDTAGQPVRRAWLRLHNTFFQAATIADRPAVTGPDGTFTAHEVPASAIGNALEVVAEGYRTGEPLAIRKTSEGAVTTLEVTVALAEMSRCQTVDAAGHPVPFVPVMAEYGGRNRLVTLLSDSLGRLLLETVPGPDCFLGDLKRGRPELSLVDNLWQVRVERRVAVLVRTDPWSAVGYRWQAAAGGAMSGMGPMAVAPAATDFLLWCLARDGDVVTLQPKPGESRPVAFRDLTVQLLGGFPCAILDLRSK